MKETIDVFKQCQERDVTIFDLEEELDEIPKKISALEEQFEAEKADLFKLEEQLKSIKVQLKDKEINLKSKEEQILKFEGQLMQIKTNKEYAALQGEIALLKKGCSSIEEEIIVSLDEIADIEKEITEEKKRLEIKREELENEKKSFQVLEKESRAKIEIFTKERTELLAPLDKQVKTLYEKIVIKRKGNALAKIEGEQCSACGMRIRAQTINEVRMCDQVVVCDSCTRILYVE
ncbi:zinc ribbon domain-containing protein [Candidatus Omnitrophota bacterium]